MNFLKGLDYKIKETLDEYRAFMSRIKVLARCTPEQRLLLIKNLKKFNKFPCITGDSIGETFAMEQTQVAVSMHWTGSDAAKNISDLVLDEEFSLVLEMLKFSRNIMEALRRYL